MNPFIKDTSIKPLEKVDDPRYSRYFVIERSFLLLAVISGVVLIGLLSYLCCKVL